MTSGTEWIDQAQRLFDVLRRGAAPDDAPPAAEHGTDCRWCPVCQVAAVVRGERPEVTAALADVLTASATALRTFAEAAGPDAPGPAPEPPVDESYPAPPVQRIDIA
jgi:hypothetical protein